MINVKLPWPPTVNTYYGNAKNGRKYLTKRGRDFKKEAVVQLMVQKAPLALAGRLEVRIEAHPPDRRKRDIDNIIKPLLDCITDYGLWLDDEQIDILRIRRRSIEKPGYVRVYIMEIDGESD